MSVVGIDLGTTNTVVACVRGGRVHVLADEHGRKLLPSVVSFHPNGDVLVGQAAKERRVIDARHTVFSVKRLIGRAFRTEDVQRARPRFAFELREGPGQGPLIAIRDKEYTLPEISAFVLRRARQIAEVALGEPVERAVITVPANFNELQRAATKVAGRIAGLEVLRILNEPTAAALAYGLAKSEKERVAVYDFGGGTFDCTLLDLSGNVFEVLATAGDSFLGGDDIDTAIAERMADAFLIKHRHDPRTDPQSFERLRAAAEQIKIELTTRDTAQIRLREVAFGMGGAHLDLQFGLSRSELETIATPFLSRTLAVTEDALTLAGLTPTSFNKAILVGGSTRMPIVARRVEGYFSQKPLDTLHPDEVVAIGAAIQAAALTDAARRRSVPPAPVPGGAARPRMQTLPGVSAGASSSGSMVAARERMSSVPDDAPTELLERVNAAASTSSSRPPPGMTTVRMGSVSPPRQPATTARMPNVPSTTARALIAPPFTSPPALLDTLDALDAKAAREAAARLPIPPLPGSAFPTPLPPAPTPASPPVTSNRPPAAPSSEAMQLSSDDIATATDVNAWRRAAETGSDAGARAPFGPLASMYEPAPPPQAYPPHSPHSPHSPPAATPAASASPVPQAHARADASRDVPASPFARTVGAPFPASAPHVESLAPPMTSEPLTSEPTGNDAPIVTRGSVPAPLRSPSTRPPPSYGPSRAAPVLIDVTPRALVVETVAGFCDRVIPRNARIPCDCTRSFTTVSDMQTIVRVRVAQGEDEIFGRNTYLGELELSGIRPAPRGEVSISVSFELDASGTLRVQATDVQTGRETRALLQLIGIAGDAAVAEMVQRHARAVDRIRPS